MAKICDKTTRVTANESKPARAGSINEYILEFKWSYRCNTEALSTSSTRMVHAKKEFLSIAARSMYGKQYKTPRMKKPQIKLQK